MINVLNRVIQKQYIVDVLLSDSLTRYPSYLNVPFDLSQVLFIATANSTVSIPAALRDRMELIQVPGYTEEEKLHIATRHLIPKQLKEHGLSAEQIQFPEDSVKLISKVITI